MGGNKGQSLIEAIIGLKLIMLSFTVGLMAIYIGWSQLWLSFQASKTLFCLAENYRVSVCQSRFKKNSLSFLPWGHLQNIKLTRTSRQRSNQKYNIHFEFSISAWKSSVQRSLSYQSVLLRSRRSGD